MPQWLEDVQKFVEDKPWIAVGIVTGGAALVILAVRQRDSEDDEPMQTGASSVPPLAAIPPGLPAQIVSQPVLRAPEDQREPDRSLISLIRDGRVVDVTAGPPGMQCPPGYVSAQQPGQPPRCTLVNPASAEPGQRRVFFPSRGEGEFV